MSGLRTEVLLWARRVLAKGTGAAAVDLLEIKADAGVEAAQEAFHKVARKAHPDLHRATVTADELELITQAYARVAGAYHDYKESVSTGRTRDLPTDPPPPSTARPANAPGAPAMSSKALVYFRKAELALRRGNLQDAVLQLKLANAADPGNTALRTALAEVQAELAKPPG